VALIDLDRRALGRGVAVAAAIAVPVAIVANLVVDDNKTHSGWIALMSLAVLVGLGVGAAVAAREQQNGTPLTHGIVCALAVFVAVNAFGIVRRSIAGDDIRWGRIASTAVLAVVAGTVGGMIGVFRHDGRVTEAGGAAP
jgi:putative membrane protein (TIGR04086 family)